MKRLDLNDISEDLQHCYSCELVQQSIQDSINNDDSDITEHYVPQINFNKDTENCEKIDIVHAEEPSSFCMFLEVTMHIRSDNKRRTIPLIAKLPRDHEFMTFDERRESIFYEIFASCIKPNYAVNCYSSGYYYDRNKRSIFLMDDLTKLNYKQSEGKLDRFHLKKCIKCLAQFHADTYTLQLTRPMLYRDIKEALKQVSRFQDEKKLNNFFRYAISTWTSVDENLKLKIEQKIHEMRFFRDDVMPTIIHGRFVRSKVMFKYDHFRKLSDIKIIGWQAMSIGSPGVDFARILLSNLPLETDVLKLEAFCRKMLDKYMKKLLRKCPLIQKSDNRLLQDILFKIGYTFAHTFLTIENYEMVVQVLNRLGSFDPEPLADSS